jgi:hypothetical protein
MARMITSDYSFPFTATSLTATQTIQNNGYVTNLVFSVPNFTNGITGTLTVLDDLGSVIYDSTAKAKNASYVVASLSIPVDYKFTAKVTLSGVAGGDGGTATVRLFTDTQ